MKFWREIKRFFQGLEKRLLRSKAHKQKQYCYASIARQMHPESDPCEQCFDANCPVKLLEERK